MHMYVFVCVYNYVIYMNVLVYIYNTYQIYNTLCHPYIVHTQVHTKKHTYCPPSVSVEFGSRTLMWVLNIDA